MAMRWCERRAVVECDVLKPRMRGDAAEVASNLRRVVDEMVARLITNRPAQGL